MSFIVGQRVFYNSINGKKQEATIKLRKIDFEEGYINSDYAKGGFDYLILVNGIEEPKFCNQDQIEEIFIDNQF